MSTQISAGGVTIRRCLVCIVATIISAVAFAGSSELSAVPGLRSYAEPEFPKTLRLSTIGDGYATIAFTISDRGRIDDSVTLEASHPAFAQTVMKVLPSWRFTPGTGKTIPRREVIRFNFHRTGMVKVLNSYEAHKALFPAAVEESSIRTLAWDQLDAQPQQLPALGQALQSQVLGQRVMVHFILDTQGQVRVPVVPGATDPQLATAVLATVKQWKFTQPTYQGQLVAAERVYEFPIKVASKQ